MTPELGAFLSQKESPFDYRGTAPQKVGDVMGDTIKLPITLRVASGAVSVLPDGFSGSRQVAELCDQLLPEVAFAARVARGHEVSDLVEALPPELYQKLEGRFGPAPLAELLSLEKENDPELFFSGILNLAGRLAQNEATTLTARGLYHLVESSSDIRGLVTLAKGRRNTLEGKGDFGDHAESFFRHVGKQSGDYRTLLALFAGSMVGSGLYNFTRHQAGKMMTQALIARGIGPATIEAVMMRFKSRIAGWAVGSLGAALTERSLRQSMGQSVDWEPASVARDSAMASLNLFAWRSSVAISDAYALRAMSTVTPRNVILKEFEIFAFRQSVGGVGLGIAMLGNQKLFGQGPEDRTVAFSQLASLLVGMNFGRFAGRKALLMGH